MDSNLTIYGYNNDNRWLVVGQEKKISLSFFNAFYTQGPYTFKRLCMPWRMYKHTFNLIKVRKKLHISLGYYKMR